MISRLGLWISAAFRKLAPDPFALAVLLTALTLGLALWKTDADRGELIDSWGGSSGVWNLLAFGMQMCLILVTGHALASSPPVSALLRRLARLPRTAPQAAVLVGFVACALAVLNWGLGLIAGALLARRVGIEMSRKGVAVHYPLLAAAGYLGLAVWHGGFSGSAPLKVTTEKDLAEVFAVAAPIGPIDLSQTLLSPMNLFVTGGLVVLAPLLAALLMPRDGSRIEPAERFIDLEESADGGRPERAERKPLIPWLLEDTPVVTAMLVGMIAWWGWRFYLPGGEGARSGLFSLSPNSVNLTVLMLGLVCHGTPMRYVRAVEDAASSCAGIILQFPLYAGIMGLMTASGLTVLLSAWVVEHSSAGTLPLFTMGSAAAINLFVPSGGGQWAVQGPIAINAAVDAGVDPAKMVMAVAYGDQLTNMLQPFWALPLLAITGVRARDIVGYTAIVMVAAGAWVVLGLLLF